MKVILKEDVEKLGEMGDVVEVSDGYARNYLLPAGLAVEATKEQIQELKELENKKEKKEQEKRKEAQNISKELDQKKYKFPVKAGEKGRLFGSVTSQDIADKLSKDGFEIDKRNIEMEDNIKSLGIHKIPVKIFQDINAEIQIEVVEA